MSSLNIKQVNITSNSGATALHFAVANKSLKIAKILLSNKDINVSAVDRLGVTPFGIWNLFD